SAAALLVAMAAEHPDELLRKDAAAALGNAKGRDALEALAKRFDRFVDVAAPLGALELSTCIAAVFRLDPARAYERIAERHADVQRAALDLLARDAARDRTAKITGPSEGFLKADARWIDRSIAVLRGETPNANDLQLQRSAIEVLGASGDARAVRPLI